MPPRQEPARPRHLTVDHITIAGRNLTRLRQTFARLGIETEYGGTHSNNITHMALTGLEDGSYLELISTLQEGERAPLWPDFISGDAGFCAWAVVVDDISRETERMAALGVPVRGPAYMHRVRPDGVQAEWDLTILGDGDPGRTLPFLIADRTPRAHRVVTSASETARGADGRLAPDRLAGIATIVVGVTDLDSSIELFRQAYDWPEPARAAGVLPDATVAAFEGAPVALAAAGGSGWLHDRLARFGPCPCACLVGAQDLDAAARRFDLDSTRQWFGRRVAWFDTERAGGLRIAIIGRTDVT